MFIKEMSTNLTRYTDKGFQNVTRMLNQMTQFER